MGKRKDRELWGEVLPTPGELNNLVKELMGQSFREAFVTMLSLFDIAVETWLYAEWKETRKEFEALCLDDAPLGTSRARILIARCMGMITANEYEAMELIRKVRNGCGHRYKIDYNSDSYKDCFIRIKPLRVEVLTETLRAFETARIRIQNELRRVGKTKTNEQIGKIGENIDRVSELIPEIDLFRESLLGAPYSSDLLKSVSVKLFHTLYINMYMRFEHKYNHDRSKSLGDTLKLYSEEYASLLSKAKPNMS